MASLKEPSPDLFKYGFLTVRAARVLAGLSSGRVFDDESRKVICAAKGFMEDVLNGEALISGDTKDFSPSKEGLQAFQYGFSALGVMRKRGKIDQLNSRNDTQLILTEIKGTLEGLLCLKHSTVILNQKDSVRRAANFFGIIAKSLCNQARNYPFVEDNELL
jgi:hypothetical protein